MIKITVMIKKGSHNCKYKLIGYDKQQIKNNMTIQIHIFRKIQQNKLKKLKPNHK